MKTKLTFLIVLLCWVALGPASRETTAAAEGTVAWCGDGICQYDGCPVGGPESPCDGCQEDNGCCPDDCESGGGCNPNWGNWEAYAYMGYAEQAEYHWEASHWDCYMKEGNTFRRQDQNQCEADQFDCGYWEIFGSRIHDAYFAGQCAQYFTPPSVGSLDCPY